MVQNILDLTNQNYNELRYDSASKEVITGEFVREVCLLLNKCGIDVESKTVYDDVISAAVSEFQSKVKMSITGILNTSTWQAMLYYSENMSDIIESDESDEEDLYNDQSSSPHFNSFFDEDNFKTHRKNKKDIKIVFGNNSISKTIKDVFMRSVSVEVDTSGNPISEIYEFIARDVIETDEISDLYKYNGIQDYTPSDIQYNFDYELLKENKNENT